MSKVNFSDYINEEQIKIITDKLGVDKANEIKDKIASVVESENLNDFIFMQQKNGLPEEFFWVSQSSLNLTSPGQYVNLTISWTESVGANYYTLSWNDWSNGGNPVSSNVSAPNTSCTISLKAPIVLGDIYGYNLYMSATNDVGSTPIEFVNGTTSTGVQLNIYVRAV